jgi:DNA polymerase-1
VAEPQVLQDEGQAVAALAGFSDAPFVALDTETSGLDPHTDRVLLIQVGTDTQQVLIDATRVGRRWVEALFSPDRVVVMHNATFDLKMLAAQYDAYDCVARAQVADTQIAEMLLRNGRKSDVVMQGFALKALAERYAGMELDKTIRQGFYGIQSLDELSPAELHYARRDVEATWKVYAQQLPELERDGLLRVAGIEGAAAPAFAGLELFGFGLDADAWRARVTEEQSQSQASRQQLDWEFRTVADRDLFGQTTLNYDHDEEVLAALGKLGVSLRTVRREALLACGHPAARALAEYREHQKIVSTYGEGFLAHLHPETGRLHPRFKALGASTGRAACGEPNLQNIPGESAFRECFRAPPGRVLITADYAGAELRVLAEMSEDPVFLRTLSAGEDLHARVASVMFRKPVTKQTEPELRARAKAINFGLAYGMGVGGLARQLGTDEADAEGLLTAYFKAFPKIRGFLDAAAKTALRRGYAETLAGRKLWFTDMRRDGRDEGSLVRIAKNMPIQGTNADLTKIAMARICAAFAEEGLDARLVNMVHDELVVEAAESDADAARRIVERHMRSAGAELLRRVPMEVDLQVGPSWGKRGAPTDARERLALDPAAQRM